MACSMRKAMASESNCRSSPIKRETLALDTPARSATSFMVTRTRGDGAKLLTLNTLLDLLAGYFYELGLQALKTVSENTIATLTSTRLRMKGDICGSGTGLMANPAQRVCVTVLRKKGCQPALQSLMLHVRFVTGCFSKCLRLNLPLMLPLVVRQ